jgi:adenylate cyclase
MTAPVPPNGRGTSASPRQSILPPLPFLQKLAVWLGGLPIAYKLAMAVCMVLLLGVGLLMLVVLRYQDQLLNEQIDTYGGIIASQFASSATEPLFTDDIMSMQVLAVNLVHDERVRGVAILNEQGQTVAHAGLVPALGPSWFTDKTHAAQTVSAGEGITYTSPVNFQGVTAGWILVDFTPVEVSRNFERMVRAVITVTILMLLLVMAFAYWMSRRMARPIEMLVNATEEIGAGNYHVNLPSRGRDEIGHMFEAINRMGAELDEKHRLQGVLSRVVATDVAETLMNPETVGELSSTRVEASVLFVDIVGFTSLAEREPTEKVVNLLNEYFTYFTLCSQLFFGTVDKFIGDCAMVIFGAPKCNEDHRFNAVACAVVIQRLLAFLNEQRRAQGEQEVQVRIGINSGEMMAGTIGTAQRMEYTVVGDAVNLASRLTDLAGPGEVLVGQSTLKYLGMTSRVESQFHSALAVKGKHEPVEAYTVSGISKDYMHVMDNLIEDIVNSYPQMKKQQEEYQETEVADS